MPFSFDSIDDYAQVSISAEVLICIFLGIYPLYHANKQLLRRISGKTDYHTSIAISAMFAMNFFYLTFIILTVYNALCYVSLLTNNSSSVGKYHSTDLATALRYVNTKCTHTQMLSNYSTFLQVSTICLICHPFCRVFCTVSLV